MIVPKSHITYFSMYHCLYRGNDYINLIKVLKSQRLIKAGCLENKTIGSLAQRCNFNSSITFFKNFKKQTGVSLSEFNFAIYNNPNNYEPLKQTSNGYLFLEFGDISTNGRYPLSNKLIDLSLN